MAGRWPGETQCAVTLTFDVISLSAMIRRNPDVEKVPSMRSHGRPATTPPCAVRARGAAEMLERLTRHVRERPHVSFEHAIDVARPHAERESLE